MATQFTIGKNHFYSQAMAVKAAQQVRDRHPLKTPIRDKGDHEFIVALFHQHPACEEKLAGRTLDHFEVHPNVGGSRCFYVVFSDGSMIDFSFIKAIKAAKGG